LEQKLRLQGAARILTIAGSDSGGGAGVAADLKTIDRLGGHGLLAVTAVTAQTTQEVRRVWAVPAEMIAAQIDAAWEDIGVDAAKCGMLLTAEAVECVVERWRRDSGVPLVVDPVLRATAGQPLMTAQGTEALRRLLPFATLLTPNLPEAEVLTGLPVSTEAERRHAARELLRMGAGAVLIKGGHGGGPSVVDLLFDGHRWTAFSSPRQATRHTHGTGCTLSAAVATGLGQGMPLQEAVHRAVVYVQAAIHHAPGLGKGRGPLGHRAGQLPWSPEGEVVVLRQTSAEHPESS